MDLEYKIERELTRAVENNTNFHQIAGCVRWLFHNVELNREDQDKILNNLINLIHDQGAQ